MDVAEILKNCPKGTKLYSLVDGEVTLDNILEIGPYTIQVALKDGTTRYYTKDGLYFTTRRDGECVLFPSKEQRDWSKFGVSDQVTDQETKPQFKPFDKVLVRDRDDKTWRCDIFSHLGDNGDTFICLSSWWRQCIPYEGNEHLFGTKINPK